MTSTASANEKTPLNVCVCGWYYLDDWYASLLRLQHEGDVSVYVVANREHPLLDICGLPYQVRENTGLEFGAYNHYLHHVWEDGPVVFTHDDMGFKPVMGADAVVRSGEMVFPRLANLDMDQGYVFSSRQEDAVNWGKHGRMMLMSPKLIRWCLERGGIGYDQDNSKNHNFGINLFDEMMKQAEMAGFDTRNKIYFPGLAHGHRGEFKEGRKWRQL